MRIVSAVAFIVLALVVADLVYWRHRLAPVLDAPGIELKPTALELVPPGPVRPIDVGYASFDVPQELAGEAVQRGSSLFVELMDAARAHSTLTICPPVSDHESSIKQALANFSEVSGESLQSFWQLRRRALATRPFSIWTVPFRRRQRVYTDLTLLLLKSVQTHGARQIAIYEDDRFGVTVTTRADFTYVELADKTARAGQLFILPPEAAKIARAFVSALVHSYRAKTTDFRPESLAADIRRTGIPRLATVDADTDSTRARLRDEQSRLKATLEQLEKQHEP